MKCWLFSSFLQQDQFISITFADKYQWL